MCGVGVENTFAASEKSRKKSCSSIWRTHAAPSAPMPAGMQSRAVTAAAAHPVYGRPGLPLRALTRRPLRKKGWGTDRGCWAPQQPQPSSAAMRAFSNYQALVSLGSSKTPRLLGRSAAAGIHGVLQGHTGTLPEYTGFPDAWFLLTVRQAAPCPQPPKGTPRCVAGAAPAVCPARVLQRLQLLPPAAHSLPKGRQSHGL